MGVLALIAWRGGPDSLICWAWGRGKGRPCSHRMAQEEGGSLPEVPARVGASDRITDVARKLHFYDGWAPGYDQDVAALQYHAPCLAVDCLTQAVPGPPHTTLILDVACGTGLVAAELQARGFLQLHGVDGSPGMLEQSRARGFYQCLSLCILGQEPLPSPEGTFDAVLMVGALSDGQVPCSAVPELLRVTKPGGLVCLTPGPTRPTFDLRRH